MPFPMKIQPIDSTTPEFPLRNDLAKPVVKSRFKRLFERKEKSGVGEAQNCKENGEFEPSSICLAKMVQNFLEESNEKQTTKCGRSRCNCFNGNCNDSSDDELDLFGGFSDSFPSSNSGDAYDFLKSLVTCASVAERNLLADASKIVESNKNCKGKDDCRKVVNEGLQNLGYDSSICKSRWEKASSFPAGEYEYIDVVVDGERILIDIDFRSEFEIARSTGNYKLILQSVPLIFVGKSDRLQQIVSILSGAAKQSLKKKGMHFPPWRKAEYMRAKWLSAYTRLSSTTTPPPTPKPSETKTLTTSPKFKTGSINTSNFSGEFELVFAEKSSSFSIIGSDSGGSVSVQASEEEKEKEKEEKITVVVSPSPWQPPAVKPKSFDRGAKIVTGLASILKEKP